MSCKHFSHPTQKTNPKRLPGKYDLFKIWNPSWFQGNREKSNYFEGWYFKVINPTTSHAFAFIPGISLAPADQHAFVQVINGKTGQTWYFRYPLSEFCHADNDFHIQVGESSFSANMINLALDSPQGNFSGKLTFSHITPFTTSFLKPGIMGWYRYVPFMECYHGLVSLDHHVHGSLTVNTETISFTDGKGYTEKDWGRSMPEAWIWMQTNSFSKPQTSFMLSVAKIPWIGRSFTGFLGFLLLEGKRYDFATYTGAVIRHITHAPEKLNIQIDFGKYILDVNAIKGNGGMLVAPESGKMQRIIHECIDAEITVQLIDNKGNQLFVGTGKNAGLEITGDPDTLDNFVKS